MLCNNKPARVLVPTFCLNSTGLLTTLTTGTICVSSALDRYHSYLTSLLMHIVRHWTVHHLVINSSCG